MTVAGVEIRGPVEGRAAEVLSDPALELIARLHREFDGRRRELLDRRDERQAELDAGGTLDFLPDTAEVRQRDWSVVMTLVMCVLVYLQSTAVLSWMVV